MSGKEKLVNWIKFYKQFKNPTTKQIQKEKERLQKVMEDFDKVWGDDLDYLDLIDEHNKRELGKKTICKWNS